MKKRWAPPWKLSKTQDFIGLDLSERTAKIVCARPFGNSLRVEHFAAKEFDESDDPGMIAFVQEALGQFQAKIPRIHCVIPARHFISRNIDMPSNNQEEIAKIINLQLGRFTPYSREEIVVDYLSREVAGQHYTNVLLIIVHRKIVDKYTRILDHCGLMMEKICVGPEAVSYALTHRKIPTAQRPLSAGIHLGEAASDLSITIEGRLVFVRSIAVGANNFLIDRGSATTDFCNELNKSLIAYQDEGLGEMPAVFFLCGVPAELENLSATLRKEIPLIAEKKADLEILDIRQEFDIEDRMAAFLHEEPEHSFFELAATVGHAPSLKMDLIPKEVKLKKRVRENAKEIMTLGILLMSMFVMVGFSMAMKIYFKDFEISKLEKINQETFDQARLLEKVSTKSRAIRKILESRGKGLKAFNKITELVGDEVFLSLYDYDLGGNLKIAGTAGTMSQVFALVTRLEESGYFESVKAEKTLSRREGKNEVADFEIVAKFGEGFYG
ncbi:MAG: pilus assembly protein PilM [Candidatus Omnitrophota bacterium]